MTLFCQKKECGRVLGEADGEDFRIRIRCRRCKHENTFTPSPKMLNQLVQKACDPYEQAFN